ncbi:family 78 glycoside hydrolase catalytic domain [Alkalicoccus halolimnae]|uniref:alpha-L-rhamnosidase n=1 Tax=Alkalicoccus halolimnae TaxID=1667239 RepID=A0A5C7FFR9_9BACI|nr:family 78 glycoside hydrolase catalytic domain [Alkalicoccus halolimnae]TXF86157.1 Bacterial alpha-L-rhamnosidase [Alkalicoccus halolimnae]
MIPYEGEELDPLTKYEWQVQGWDENDKSIEWSDKAVFITGKRNTPWQASWISLSKEKYNGIQQSRDLPVVRFQHTIIPQQAIASIRITSSALGVYTMQLNGALLTEDRLAPGFTDYEKRIQYQMYDITDQWKSQSGQDITISADLAPGWYCGQVGMIGREMYGTIPAFAAEIHVEYEDGSSDIFPTSSEWEVRETEIEMADIIHGEDIDARKQESLNNLGSPEVHAMNPDLLFSQVDPPVKVQKVWEPEWQKTKGQRTVMDFGQNLVGWVRFKASGKRNTRLKIRFAEMLEEDDELYRENLRGSRAEINYTMRGGEEEVYETRFSYFGFRYVEVSVEEGTLDDMHIEACAAYSSLEEIGNITTGHEKVNQLFHNILWGQRGNFVSIPTDCPQRDERLGWTGDAQIFARTASYNMNISNFLTKYVYDIVDAQFESGAFPDIAPDAGWHQVKAANYQKQRTILPEVNHPIENWMAESNAGWGDAGVVIPWTIYLTNGDKRVLQTFYPAMKRWMNYLENRSENGLGSANTVYSDWLAVNSYTPKIVVASAYYAHNANLMSRAATVLGHKEDADYFRKLESSIKREFDKQLIHENGEVHGDSQTGYVLALYMNLVTGEKKELVLKKFLENLQRHNNHLTTGFLGVGYLLPSLTEEGRQDKAYDLLLNESYPSWIYSINHGATTIWERWDGWTAHNGFQTAQMNSFNHYSLGSVGEWMYRYMAGIETSEQNAGFRHIRLQPYPDPRVGFVDAVYETPYGEVRSHWKLDKDDFSWEVTVPPNTTATAVLPDGSKEIELEAGTHVFQSTVTNSKASL